MSDGTPRIDQEIWQACRDIGYIASLDAVQHGRLALSEVGILMETGVTRDTTDGCPSREWVANPNWSDEVAFQKRVDTVLEKGAQRLEEVVKTQELEAQRRKEHAEKYPMCNRLGLNAGTKAKLLEFIEWLEEEKGIEIAEYIESLGEHRPIGHHRREAIVHEFLEIDNDALEKERRQILAEQRKANGDTEEDE